MKDPYQHITDNELLIYYYTEKDNKWVGILLQRYTLLLLGTCMKYLKNEEEAKDAVQQIFLKAITELSKYKVEYFKSWIYMVAKNHCLMKLRDKNIFIEDIDITCYYKYYILQQKVQKKLENNFCSESCIYNIKKKSSAYK